MVTAWSRSGMPRVRPWAPALRLLWMGALLFGLVYMHGASAESVRGHLLPTAASTVNATVTVTASEHAMEASGPANALDPLAREESRHHPETSSSAVNLDDLGNHDSDGHDSGHPAQECMPGQPQYGPAVVVPCAEARAWREGIATGLPAAAVWAEGPETSGHPLRGSERPTVLRI